MNIQVIINPQALRIPLDRATGILKERLGESLAGIAVTGGPGHATVFARTAVASGADTVVVVGGDGTVNEVLGVLAYSNLALAVIPAGTANDLASLFGIPRDFETACDMIRRRCLRRMDLIRVNGRFYATAGGIGLACEVADAANRLRRASRWGRVAARLLGSGLYVASVLWAFVRMMKKHTEVQVRSNGHLIVTDCFSLMIDNQAFLGKHFEMSPGARNDDGLFDVCLIGSTNTQLQTLRVLMRVLNGSHVRLPYVRSWRERELFITSRTPIRFFGDGEVFGENTRFHIQIVPEALNLIVPFTEDKATQVQSALPCSQAA